MGRIRELPKSSARVLTSAQIISSVFCVVKELVENAFDSGASNLEVKLEDYGLSKIEVKDNGCGIDKNDLEFVASPHFTSKITSFTDLENVQSYGFRGEALSAICAVAQLTVTTRSAADDVGSVTNYDSNGLVVSSQPTPFQQGTSVSVLNLFKNIPVRRQWYRSDKNKKDELRKIEEILSAYGIINHGIRMSLFHNKNVIWQKIGVQSTKDAVIQAFGSAVFNCLKHVQYHNDESKMKLEMYLPKINAISICGSSTLSRCVVAINKRLVRMKAMDKLLKECYNVAIHNTGRAKYPVCFVSLVLPSKEIDVNIEPNKTSVMLKDSDEILSQFSNLLKAFYKAEEDSQCVTSDAENSDAQSSCLNFHSTAERLHGTSCEFSINSSKDVSSDKETGNHTNLRVTSMSKRDVRVLGGSQSSKKKQKTGSCSSKTFDNHLNTINQFFQNPDTCSENLETNSNASVIFHRIPPEKHLFQNKESACVNQRKILEFTVNSELSSNLGVCEASFIGDSLVFENENLKAPFHHQDAGNNKEENNYGYASSMSSQNNAEEEEDEAVTMQDIIAPGNLNLSENALINSYNSSVQVLTHESVEPADCEAFQIPKYDQKSKISVDDVNGEQNSETLWSRGIHPSKGFMQPIAVLQPQNDLVTDLFTKQCEGVSKKHITSMKKPHLSEERKLTAFDFFCRSYRLQTVAASPGLSNQQVAQLLSEKWSKLPALEKAVFKNMVDKEYPKEVKKKEKLGKTIHQNLCLNKTSTLTEDEAKRNFRKKKKIALVTFNIEEIKESFPLQKFGNEEDKSLIIVGILAPGIWLCRKRNTLSTLNTFCLQERIIYSRLLDTYQFQAEPLEMPVMVPESHLGDEALSVLSQVHRDSNGNIIDERLIANGFEINFVENGDGSASIQLMGILKYVAYYGVSDLKECLLLIKKSEFASKLSYCRPAKLIFYLQSEANRMCRQTPPIQRQQDVEDLILQKESLIPTSDVCIHHKAFFHELWILHYNENSEQ